MTRSEIFSPMAKEFSSLVRPYILTFFPFKVTQLPPPYESSAVGVKRKSNAEYE